MTLIRFRNCQLLRQHALIVDDLWIRDGKIINPEKIFFEERIHADIEYDCRGVLIAPGYIDLQINGAFGHDFSSADEASDEMLHQVARQLTSHGVTAFAPTIVSSKSDTYKSVLKKYKRSPGSASNGASILGIHIEGPFINETKRGAHRTDFLRQNPKDTTDLLDCYGSFANVSIITIAPEIPNMIETIIPDLVATHHLTVSIGHSTATLDQGERAICAGARFITHLFNAMLPFHHRDPGLVGLLTSHCLPSTIDLFYGLIVDNIHTHSAAVRLAHRVHPQGLVLVTDAVPALGLPDGVYHMGASQILVQNKRATNAGTETLCGSIATMAECVQNMRQALLDGEKKERKKEQFVVEAIEAATLHPARVLRMEKQKGTLAFGADGDFIFLDENLNVLSTFIAGEQAWTVDEHWALAQLRQR